MSNRRRLRAAQPVRFSREPHDGPVPRWNGERCEAVRVRLVVGESEAPQYWARHLVGQERAAVRVTYGGSVFYLDDEDGSGWAKVTEGGGSPRWPHRSLSGWEAVPSREADR